MIYPFQPYVKSDEFKPISMATVLKFQSQFSDRSLMTHENCKMVVPQLIVTNFKCHIFDQFLFQRFVILIHRKWRIKLDTCTHLRDFTSPKWFAVQMFEKTMSYVIWRSSEGYPKISESLLSMTHTIWDIQYKLYCYDNLI